MRAMSPGETNSAIEAVERWKQEREAWSKSSRGLPPSFPLSYVDTARLIDSLRAEVSQAKATE